MTCPPCLADAACDGPAGPVCTGEFTKMLARLAMEDRRWFLADIDRLNNNGCGVACGPSHWDIKSGRMDRQCLRCVGERAR